jgi:hypothetical protein
VLDQAKKEVTKSFKFLMKESPQKVVSLEETSTAIKVDDQKRKSPFEAHQPRG